MTADGLRRVLLDYEIRSSWWAPLCSWGWAQDFAAWHYAGKVRRKLARCRANSL